MGEKLQGHGKRGRPRLQKRKQNKSNGRNDSTDAGLKPGATLKESHNQNLCRYAPRDDDGTEKQNLRSPEGFFAANPDRKSRGRFPAGKISGRYTQNDMDRGTRSYSGSSSMDSSRTTMTTP